MNFARSAVWALGGLLAFLPTSHSYVLILAGGSQGLLTPCGCTEPMSGGMRRKASVIRKLWVPGRTIYLENGRLTSPEPMVARQNQLKLEAQAELFSRLGATAVHVDQLDVASSPDAALALRNLLGPAFLSDAASSFNSAHGQAFIEKGPLLIGGASGEGDARALSEEAEARQLVPVLLLSGGFELATRIARDDPSLRLIQYSAGGHPSQERVGNTLLVTAGDMGKAVVRLEYSGGQFSGFQAIDLSPSFEDDDLAAQIFRTYLGRVRDEGLINQIPRHDSLPFAGSSACAKCHPAASATWADSGHAKALRTLSALGEQIDPDCLKCHVVEVTAAGGYTPQSPPNTLDSVGCESCHGPAASHAYRPDVKLPRVTESDCLRCHTSEQSPNFDFKVYWQRIRH